MQFTTQHFETFEKEKWNTLVEKMSGQNHLYTWQNLNYQSAFRNIKNLSFCVKEHNKVVALVALAINSSKKKKVFGFGNNLVPKPIFEVEVTSSLRRKIYKYIFENLKIIAKRENTSLINFISHPVCFLNNKASLNSKNQFELISQSLNYIVHNTLIHELSAYNKEQMLNMLSKYHRKNIKKIKTKSLKFLCINHKNKKNDIIKHFNNLKKYHFISAGKKTRPNKTWEIMKTQIYNNEADLFLLSHKGKPISYLYCGRYKNFTWGWSQVNLREYEKEFMPRHLLEWKTLLYYKKNKIDFYEIGERYFPQKNFKPTLKEISISEFKEKYGANYYPKSEFKIKIDI